MANSMGFKINWTYWSRGYYFSRSFFGSMGCNDCRYMAMDSFHGFNSCSGIAFITQRAFESAMIDGAKPFQIFRRLTLPMLHKVIAVAVLIRGIDLWRMVDYVLF
ncbi:MAG: hypothetical protein CM15mP109_15250 [Candidatus Dadabacteria bacterium]|nr:MAG: hypothetical protein CM15mP109_15250 [Candidatus Dadabacteria bacterium]